MCTLVFTLGGGPSLPEATPSVLPSGMRGSGLVGPTLDTLLPAPEARLLKQGCHTFQLVVDVPFLGLMS